MKHIKSFGVELEGLFKSDAYARLFDGLGQCDPADVRVRVLDYTHGDGSVWGMFPDPATMREDLRATASDDDFDEDEDYDADGFDPDTDCCCRYRSCSSCYPDGYRENHRMLSSREGGFRCAEWSSPPIFVDAFPQWRDPIIEWWPHSVNTSCGMHCHLGLRTPRDYARLLDLGYTFTHDLVRELRREFDTGTFKSWPEARNALRRFSGNTYCQVPDDTGFHMRQFISGDNRYTAVNFSAFRSHGTIELRILPAILHAARGITLLDYAMNFTNDYLATKGRQLIRVERKPIVVVAEDDMVTTMVIERS